MGASLSLLPSIVPHHRYDLSRRASFSRAPVKVPALGDTSMLAVAGGPRRVEVLERHHLQLRRVRAFAVDAVAC